MKKHFREVQYFLFGQHFAEGLRITFAILLPSLLFFYYNQIEAGLALSLGALCTSITDAPGPLAHRKQGMLYCILVVFITTLITGFAQLNVYTLGLEVLIGAFLFSMFNVYGMRAAAIGSAGLLVLILNLDKPLTVAQVLPNAALVAAGGVWYMAISLLFSTLRPYRLPQRLLGDCIRELADFLSIKAHFYNTGTNLEEGYRKLVAQQIVVHENQEAVREILFKTRQIVRETTATGRALVFIFVESVDLFEDITATYYDYETLRKRYGHTGLLSHIGELIQQLAKEVDNIGFAIQANTVYNNDVNFEERLATLRIKIDAVALEEKEGSTFVLKKIVVNLRKLVKRITLLRSYAANKQHTIPVQKGKLEHHRFVGHQNFSVNVLTGNFSFQSALFRHAVRTAIVCLAGFVLSKTLSSGPHSYWILMTIAFMMKPAYSLTKKRNVERVVGTLGGGVIGVLILVFVHNSTALFVLLVLLMLGTYSFLRANYLVMVFFVTPFVLILFHFLGLGYITIVKERIVDTVIGCVIAFTASYLLLPKWEGEQLPDVLKGMLKANFKYLQTVSQSLIGKPVALLDYKLARKEVYVQSANLSAAFQRMLSEPKQKRKSSKQLHQFVVLNHILFSNIASVAATLLPKAERVYPAEMVRPVKRSLHSLSTAVNGLDKTFAAPQLVRVNEETPEIENNSDERLLQEQLEFIQSVSADIEKITCQMGKVLHPSYSTTP